MKNVLGSLVDAATVARLLPAALAAIMSGQAAASPVPMQSASLARDAAQLQIIPSADAMNRSFGAMPWQRVALDANTANIARYKLLHLYAAAVRVEYPELAAANGDVLPIDTSVKPWAQEWRYRMIDRGGAAKWIDDSGNLVPTGFVTTREFGGRLAEMGFGYELNFFDLERATQEDLELPTEHAENAREAIERKTNWTWLFGDRDKSFVGLCNHPNIPITVAPLNAALSSRRWDLKSNDEIIADVALLIQAVPRNTIRKHYVTKVFMPLRLVQICQARRMGTGDGTLTLWQYILDNWKGDDTGQGKVSFRILNECGATTDLGETLRAHPESNVDESGITGEFLLACPADNKTTAAFIRARPFTQLAPQTFGFKTINLVHSRIGGVKITRPLAFHRLDFLT